MIMKHHTRLLFLTAIVFSLGLIGCKDDPAPSIYNSSVGNGSTPVINSINPTDSAQGGVDTLIITGSNFSTVTAENLVYVNTTNATIYQSSGTQLSVKVPRAEVGDSALIRIAVQGAQKFSNGIYYKILPAIVDYGEETTPKLLGAIEFAKAVTTDILGNVYVSITLTTTTGSTDLGVKKITPDGVVTTFAPKATGVSEVLPLKMGPNGSLYTVRSSRRIFRYNSAGSDAGTAWITLTPASVSIADMDFSENKTLWAAGSNTTIANATVYAILPTATVKTFPFPARVNSVRVYNNYLYMSAQKDSAWGIWRAPLLPNDSLGTPELYFDFTVYGSAIPQGITFSSTGDLYVATDAPQGIIVIFPSKNSIARYVDYSSLFGTTVKYFAWGNGTELYAVTSAGKLLKIYVRAHSAPYYGQ
ncbi:MAG TPA: hypothetical protein DCQ28_02575 [Bacteroidetes bacterium]|nr:hypothetical protein [Bacteroidota bacterium]